MVESRNRFEYYILHLVLGIGFHVRTHEHQHKAIVEKHGLCRVWTISPPTFPWNSLLKLSESSTRGWTVGLSQVSEVPRRGHHFFKKYAVNWGELQKTPTSEVSRAGLELKQSNFSNWAWWLLKALDQDRRQRESVEQNVQADAAEEKGLKQISRQILHQPEHDQNAPSWPKTRFLYKMSITIQNWIKHVNKGEKCWNSSKTSLKGVKTVLNDANSLEIHEELLKIYVKVMKSIQKQAKTT